MLLRTEPERHNHTETTVSPGERTRLAKITHYPSRQDLFETDLPNIIFRISFYYYAIIGFAISMLVGIVTSHLTRNKNDELVHPDFLSPVVYWMLPKDQKYTPREYQCVGQAMQVISYDKEKEAL